MVALVLRDKVLISRDEIQFGRSGIICQPKLSKFQMSRHLQFLECITFWKDKAIA